MINLIFHSNKPSSVSHCLHKQSAYTKIKHRQSVHSFICFHARFFCLEHRGDSSPMSIWKISRFPEISDSSAGSPPWWDQARLDMWSCHLVLITKHYVGHHTVGAASRTCLTNPSWDILGMWPNRQSWDLSIQRNDSTFTALQTSLLHTLLRSVTLWTFCKNPIFTTCTWDSTSSVINQNIKSFQSECLKI